MGGFKISNPMFAIVGASSLFTTVEDLAKWDKNFYTRQVGSTIGVPEIAVRGVLNDGTEIDYARAMKHGTHRGLPTLGHGGADAGYRAQFTRYPEQDFSVAVLCNSPVIPPSKLAKKVAEVYLENQMTPEETSGNDDSAPQVVLSVEELKAFQGTYRSANSNQPVPFALKGESLEVDLGYFKLKLVPKGDGRFESVTPYGKASFEFVQKDGMTMEMDFLGSVTSGVRLEDKPETAQDRLQYAGSYYSDELETDYTVSATSDGKLLMSFAKYEDLELTPKYNWRFFL